MDLKENVAVNAKAYTAFGATFTVQALFDELNKILIWLINGALSGFGIPVDILTSIDKVASWGLLFALSFAAAYAVKKMPNAPTQGPDQGTGGGK